MNYAPINLIRNWCKQPKMLKTISCILMFVGICHVQGRPQVIFGKNESIQEEPRSNDTGNARTRVLFRGNKNNKGSDVLADLLGELVDGITEQEIIFPDTYQLIFDEIPKLEQTPKCARSNTFCEEFERYPYNQIKQMLKRKRVGSGLFGKDEMPDDNYSISNRNGDIENFVCSSVSRTIFPKIAQNKNNKWKYIINQGEKDGYIQGIRIEVCRKEGSGCDLISENAPGYITSCKQKYMMRRLISLSDNGDAIPDTFQLPSACCCAYRKDLSFLTRFGESDARIKAKTPRH